MTLSLSAVCVSLLCVPRYTFLQVRLRWRPSRDRVRVRARLACASTMRHVFKCVIFYSGVGLTRVLAHCGVRMQVDCLWVGRQVCMHMYCHRAAVVDGSRGA